MRITKVLTSFRPFSDAAFEQYVASIIAAITGNANFATPAPTLIVLEASRSAYSGALSAAATGGKQMTIIKNQKRKALTLLLFDLALYVQLTSDGDAAIMASSGFNISKQPAPYGPLPKPSNFKIINKGAAVVKVSINKIAGAKSYQWEYRLTTVTDWVIFTSTKANAIITELESGKEYNFRVVPIGTSDVREYSDEISCFIL